MPSLGKPGCSSLEGKVVTRLRRRPFLGFVIGYLEQVGELQLSVLAGEDLHATTLAKKATSGGLDGSGGWGGRE